MGWGGVVKVGWWKACSMSSSTRGDPSTLPSCPCTVANRRFNVVVVVLPLFIRFSCVFQVIRGATKALNTTVGLFTFEGNGVAFPKATIDQLDAQGYSCYSTSKAGLFKVSGGRWM